MKPHPQVTPEPTSSGTAAKYIEEREQAKALFHKLEAFKEDIEIKKIEAAQENLILPLIEADRDVIAWYNKGALMEHVDRIGYFIMSGVGVCERGRLAEVSARIDASNNDRVL